MEFGAATAILWCPTDGYMTPRKVAKAYQHRCEKLGVKFATGTAVERIVRKNGHIEGVKTNRGDVAANTSSMRQGRMLITWPIGRGGTADRSGAPRILCHRADARMTADLPCLRIPDLTLYARARDGGLLLGGWERTHCTPIRAIIR